MQVKVIYFASIREALGISEEQVHLNTNSAEANHNIKALLHVLTQQHPALAEKLQRQQALRFAVNHVMADVHTQLHEGDEVALFPPVTGG